MSQSIGRESSCTTDSAPKAQTEFTFGHEFARACSSLVWSPVSVEVAEDLELSDIGEINDAIGDSFIEIGGQRYWISSFGDQVYRLRRVIAAHGSRRQTDG
jgi:hypothetical protein